MTDLNIPYVCTVPSDLLLPGRVFKYRVIDKNCINSLLLNQVWLAKPLSFNDPFEPYKKFSGSAFSKALERSIHEAGMLCLCKSWSNLAMWSYYGDGLRGIAVGYDLARLLQTLEPVEPSCNESGVSRWKYVFDLNYSEAGPSLIDEMALLRNDSLTDAQRQAMFAAKSSAFAHEEECRIVVQPSPDSHEDYAWKGYGLYSHAHDAIQSIVFGELISEQDRQTVMAATAGRQLEFFDAIRGKTSFELRIASHSHA